MERDDEPFSYTYSAQRREEAARIRQKYLPPEEDKLEQLRRLDESAARPGRAAALTVGILGALIFGLGLCCTTVWTDWFFPGIVIGTAGLAGVGAAYPVYSVMVKRQRTRLAPQILRLSRELMGEGEEKDL